MDETTTRTRKMILYMAVATVAFVAIVVIVWYFFFPTKKVIVSDTPGGLPTIVNVPPRFNFIFSNEADSNQSQSNTVVTLPEEQPLVEIWSKPSTGNTFVTQTTLHEVLATSTIKRTKNGPTETIQVKKLLKATTSTIMFVDRTTGYVYGYDKKVGKPYQITNTTVPGVFDAYIYNNGQNILMRYLDNDRTTVISVVATIPEVKNGEDALPLINTSFLPKNVTSVSVSESNQVATYLVSGEQGGSFYTLTGDVSTKIASSPFSEWMIVYGGEKPYTHNKASAYIPGSIVSLPNFSRLESNKTGLLSNPNKYGTLLNSMWTNSGLQTYLSTRGATVLVSSKTLAPKCTWLHRSIVLLCAVPNEIPNSSEGLPDDWYQGRYFFTDSLMLIDGKEGISYPFFEFERPVPDMDVTKIAISEDDKDFLFIRKQNGSLWLLKSDLITSHE